MKKGILLILIVFATTIVAAQVKTVFNANLSFNIPAGWYLKDSALKKVSLRKTGDEYSNIEIKISNHADKDLMKYIGFDKKKFSPDPHTRTILPDAKLGNRMYKKVKYITQNKILKVDTELEYVNLFKLKNAIPGITNARIEIVITYSQLQETAMIKTADALVASMVY
jgi:hypothetical protein